MFIRSLQLQHLSNGQRLSGRPIKMQPTIPHDMGHPEGRDSRLGKFRIASQTTPSSREIHTAAGTQDFLDCIFRRQRAKACWLHSVRPSPPYHPVVQTQSLSESCSPTVGSGRACMPRYQAKWVGDRSMAIVCIYHHNL